LNLSRIIERWADHTPGKTALHFQGNDLSYAAFWAQIERITRGLAGIGVARGDRIAYLGYNDPRMLSLLFAAARLGALFVPLNWRLTVHEHRLILADCAPAALFSDAEFEKHARELPAGRYARIDETLPEADGVVAGTDYDELLIVYTSGTTGTPKGAVLSQSALLWNAVNSIHAHDLRQDDHVLSPLPMFHVGGLNNQTMPALLAGATVTLHPRFDPGAWHADVAARKPTLSLLVPATMQAVIAHPEWERTNLSCLRMITTGSMVVPESLIRTFHERGVPVGQIYGSTETSPLAIVLMAHEAMENVGSTGKPALHCEISLTDDAGKVLPDDAVGEIRVRGPNVMRRYWNNPQATATALTADGWFRTGDLARRDSQGFYWIAGRSKDLIISGGENIHPAELENVLADCPAIAECAVIGIDDAKWGEAACALIVLKTGAALSEGDVLALFKDRLARYKHPRRVVFVDSLPRNAMGKVQKFALQEAMRARFRQG